MTTLDQIDQLRDFIETSIVADWEEDFIVMIYERSVTRKQIEKLTDKEIELINSLFHKYFSR